MTRSQKIIDADAHVCLNRRTLCCWLSGYAIA